MRTLDPEVVETRKRRVLQWVIQRYIQNSAPIASQAIARDGEFDVSSATIRSILKDLEAEGYLHQPHTSSGRVPTDKGYRFFVDYLVDVQRLALEEKERIRREYYRRAEEIDALLAQTSHTLSAASRLAGFAVSPQFKEHEVQRMELIRLGPGRVLAIAVTKTGFVRHWPIRVDADADAGQVEALNRLLGGISEGRTFRELNQILLSKLDGIDQDFEKLKGMARLLVQELARIAHSESLYFEGASNLLALEPPEGFLQAPGNRPLRAVLGRLEDQKRFTRVLEKQLHKEMKAMSKSGGKKVRVRIGLETEMPELKNMSLVTSMYRARDNMMGLLGIMGPKRMEYSKMMALVDFVSDFVEQTLQKWESQKR
ncbi:MAG: heat-inducible transcription repressor HrcA [Elusimicrobia bacterium]|nr:heat-inducible transcription repressor HrcA [Elusimicrobiota bacterium]